MMMLLGELEKLVMQYLWTIEHADAKQVHAVFIKQRGGSLNTIQSTLDRLFKKGLLSREKQGHAYVYAAKVEREALLAQLIHSATNDFANEGENVLVAAFSSVSSALADEELTQLEQLIEQQRQQRKQGK
jgi:predicted transcriptional regulator